METVHDEINDTAPETSDETTASRPSVRSRLTQPAVALGISLAVVLVAALVVSILEWQSNADRANRLSSIDSLRNSAVKAADAYALDFGSYKYTDLHGPTASWTVLEDHSTPSFRASYVAQTKTVEQLIVQYKGSATATTGTTAVSSISASQAIVLVAVTEVNSETTLKTPQTTHFLLTMTLVRQKGEWLINHLQATYEAS